MITAQFSVSFFFFKKMQDLHDKAKMKLIRIIEIARNTLTSKNVRLDCNELVCKMNMKEKKIPIRFPFRIQ